MAKQKRIPAYQRVPEEKPKETTKDGNKEFPLNHLVTDFYDKTHLTWVNELPLGKAVVETYIINDEHRKKAKDDKGVWRVSEVDEVKIFQRCRRYGTVIPWKDGTKKGWGVLVEPNNVDCSGNHNYKLKTLGRGLYNDPVTVCKFVESTKGSWHGYPINYMRKKEEPIHENALHFWSSVLHVIDKSEINDIRLHEDSSLS